MLILGILAAIALPAFFNQKEKAGDAKAKEYVHSAQVAMETCNTEKGGTYVGCTETALKNIEPTLNSESPLNHRPSPPRATKLTSKVRRKVRNSGLNGKRAVSSSTDAT